MHLLFDKDQTQLSCLTTDVQSILEIPATDEIHIEDGNHGLDWTKPNSGIYNTLNSPAEVREKTTVIWIIIMWCQNDQKED